MSIDYSIKLSIISVNLNNGEGLQKTIESIVSQTFTNYEYIIIDGGSTDGSKEIIKKYVNKITYWVSELDKGIYDAQNKGILEAKGEYIIFMNSGDYFFNREVVLNVFKNKPSEDVLYGDIIRVSTNKKETVKFPKIMSFTFFNKVGLCPQSVFVKTHYHKKYMFDLSYKIFADRKFYMTLLFSMKKFKQLNQIICYYDANGFSNSPKNRKLAIEEKERLNREFIPQIINNDFEKLYSIKNFILIFYYWLEFPRLRTVTYNILIPFYKTYAALQHLKTIILKK